MSINWLTLVGAEPLAILGGRDKVVSALDRPPRSEDSRCRRRGLVVQAGDAPQIGDANKGDDLARLSGGVRGAASGA